MKKILSLIFTLLIMVSVIPAVEVSAASVVASGSCGTSATWSLDSDGVLTIGGTGAMADYTQTSFVADTPWWDNRNDIKKIVIEDGITSVGANAFLLCENVTSIEIGKDVTSIGKNGFRYLYALTSVTIPGNVKTIGDYSFNGCSKLANIVLEEGITTISSYVFGGCIAQKIVIPDTVTSIGERSFQGCSKLNTFTFGSGIKTVGQYMFYSSANLSTIYYHGTSANWSKVTKGTGWNPNNVAVTYVNYVTVGTATNGTVTVDKNMPSAGDTVTITATPDYGYGVSKIYVDGTAITGNTFTVTGDHTVTATFTKLTTASGTCGDGVNWSFNYSTGELTISGSGAMANYNYDEDDDYEDWTRTPWEDLIIEKVTIKSGVTSIGSYAFMDHTDITSVTVSSTVKTIGSYAFRGCDGLAALPALPAGVQVNSYAFKGCTGLTSVELPDTGISLGGYMFQGCNNIKYIKVPVSTTFTGKTFAGTYLYTAGPVGGGYDIEFAWTDAIPDYAFYGSSINSITIPDTVKTIGYYSFGECLALKTITLPSKLQSIGGYAFRGSYYLNNVVIPDTVTSMGEGVFYECSGLSTVTLPSGLKTIPARTFCESNLTSVTIPSGVTTIGNYAFNSIPYLKTVFLPSSITALGDYVFYNSRNITKVYFDGTKAQWLAVDGVASSGLVDGLTASQIAYRTNITYSNPRNGTIIVSDTYPYLGSTVTLTATPATGYEVTGIYVDGEEISGNTFTVTGDHTVTATTKILPVAEGTCGDSAQWRFYGDGELIITGSGDMYGYTNTSDTPWYEYISDITAVTVEDGITSVGARAFTGFTEIETVTIPSSVKIIDDYAFENCSALVNLSVAEGVETIGDYAFHVCSSLEEVTLPSTLTTMEHAAFETCRALKEITIPGSLKTVEWVTFHNCSGLTTVTLEEGVTTLNSNAFAECTSLKTVYIPSTVTTVNQIPFNLSTAIEDVYYNGSRTAWDNLGLTVPATAAIHCTEYSISVAQSENGTLTVDKTVATENETVTVTATPADGYKLAGIYVDGVLLEGDSFTVNNNHTVTAEFVSDSYSITVEGNHMYMIVTVDKETATAGETVTIHTSHPPCCAIDKLYVNGKELTADGIDTYTFTVEGDSVITFEFTESHSEDIIEKLNEAAATCTTDGGYTEKGYCYCGEEVRSETVVIPATGHTAGEQQIENETEEGYYDEVFYCTVCGGEISRATVAPETDCPHDVTFDYIERTWSDENEYHYYVVRCEECGIAIRSTIACVNPEKTTVTEVVSNSCTEDDCYEEVTYCADCGTELDRVFVETIPGTAGEHSDEVIEIENEEMPTCTEGGSYEKVAYCGECWCEFSRETIYTEATGHSYEAEVTSPTETEQGYTTYTCSTCGDSYEDDFTDPTGTAVEITVNNTASTAGATVTAPEGDWKEGTNTFTVSAEKPCVVAVSYDGGLTYVRVTATATGTDGTYSFTADITAGAQVAVVTGGDVNNDGKMSGSDITRLKAAFRGKTSLDGLQSVIGDTNGDGKITGSDITKLKAAFRGKTSLSW